MFWLPLSAEQVCFPRNLHPAVLGRSAKGDSVLVLPAAVARAASRRDPAGGETGGG